MTRERGIWFRLWEKQTGTSDAYPSPTLSLLVKDVLKVSTDEKYVHFLKPTALRLKEGPDSFWHSYDREDYSFIQLWLKVWTTAPFLSHQCSNTIPCTLLHLFCPAQLLNSKQVLLSLATPFTIILSCWKLRLSVFPLLHCSANLLLIPCHASWTSSWFHAII